MTYADALKRLRQCRNNQPDAMQILVAAEIVTALLDDSLIQLVADEMASISAGSRPTV